MWVWFKHSDLSQLLPGRVRNLRFQLVFMVFEPYPYPFCTSTYLRLEELVSMVLPHQKTEFD